MFNAIADYMIYLRVERRLSDATCTAYERNVRKCIEFLRCQDIAALAEIRTPDLRRFIADEAVRRPAPVEPDADYRCASQLLLFLRGERIPRS